MTKEQIAARCLSHKAAAFDFQADWQADRFSVGGKMFAMLGGDKQGTPIFTVKCDPMLSELLRREYPDIVPGYYMNKQHWVSVYYEKNTVPDAELERLIAGGYEAILAALPRKTRESLL